MPDQITITQTRYQVTVQSARIGAITTAQAVTTLGLDHTHGQAATTPVADTDLFLARTAAGTYLRWLPATVATKMATLLAATFAAITHKARHATGGADALSPSDIGAETANANIQSHIGVVAGNPHGTTAANIGAVALATITTAGQTFRGTGSGAIEAVDAGQALGNISGSPTIALKQGKSFTATINGSLESWANATGLTILGEKCVLDWTNSGAQSVATTGLNADLAIPNAFADIGKPYVKMFFRHDGTVVRSFCKGNT
jgi:hypothetical protein